MNCIADADNSNCTIFVSNIMDFTSIYTANKIKYDK